MARGKGNDTRGDIPKGSRDSIIGAGLSLTVPAVKKQLIIDL
jgi:hypothetical protein